MKLLPQFLVEPMYLSEKTKWWATEILSKIRIVVFNSAYTKIVKFLRAGKKVKISNFIGWFCLKDKLLGQLTQHFRAMKSFSTIWILVSNSDPQKWVNFLRVGEKTKISNFIGWVCVKDKFLEQKTETAIYCPNMKGYEKFQQNLNPGFQFTSKKLSEISSSKREGQNFKFYWLVLSKWYIAWVKFWHSSFLSWHWRITENLW